MGHTMDHSTPSQGSAQNLPQGKHSTGKNAEKKAKSTDSAPARATGNANTRSSLSKLTANISREERLRMIEEAAYFRAERRGFNGGNEMQDWLDAESEINSKYPG